MVIKVTDVSLIQLRLPQSQISAIATNELFVATRNYVRTYIAIYGYSYIFIAKFLWIFQSGDLSVAPRSCDSELVIYWGNI